VETQECYQLQHIDSRYCRVLTPDVKQDRAIQQDLPSPLSGSVALATDRDASVAVAASEPASS
jgi:hypothetical protein